MECFKEDVCKAWWGSNSVDFAVRMADGRSGGIASVWNREVFEASSTWNVPGAVIVNGVWKQEGGLMEIRTQGRKYTWYQPSGACKSKLDRFLVNEKWLRVWASTSSRGIQRLVSDHCPIILTTKSTDWGPRPFRFINAWTSHPEFAQLVEKVWGETKLDALDDTLGLEESEIIRRNEIKANIFLQMKNKISLLHQKTNGKWLREGDLNTSFFHRVITGRRKMIDFSGLSFNNQWISEPEIVKSKVKEHFQQFFKKRQRNLPRFPSDFMERKLDDNDSRWLIRPFEEKEIKEAIWNSDGNKSPGPDGFNFTFWKASWDTIKGDLVQVMAEFHANGKIPRGCNTSFVVLIPKKQEAGSIEEFRPISLISSLYKIIAKILARRLKEVMGSIISDNQSAFICGRFILDGVVILNELINEAKKKRLGRIFFKIDFAKAYDSIEWDFIDAMMELLNFDPQWRKWINGCLSSASANVLVNGSPSGEFSMERGLRQGDPMSPFLFLIAAEGLHSLIQKATSKQLLFPAEVGSENVLISHLQYADDTIFILNGSERNAAVVKNILHLFQFVSGLKVNYEKSNLIGVGVEEAKKVVDWKVRNLSLAGRITLVKAVLQAIPIYQLSFSLMPKTIVRRVNSIFVKFLWGGNGESKSLAWIKWSDLCSKFDEGGLGFRNLEEFNRVLVVKWVWRYLQERESLWARVVRSIFGEVEWGEEGRLRLGKRHPKGGWWPKIVEGCGGSSENWFVQNLSRLMGDGFDTKFWGDRWVGQKPLRFVFPRLFQLCGNKEASIGESGRWVEGKWEWEFLWRRELFERERGAIESLSEYLSVFVPCAGKKDKWTWKATKDGEFSTKSAYQIIATTITEEPTTNTPVDLLATVWKSPIPHKAKVHAWRCLRNRLATCDNLIKRNVAVNVEESWCNGCVASEETANHLFLHCHKVQQVWDEIQKWIGISSARPMKLEQHYNWFIHLGKGKKSGNMLKAVWICTVPLVPQLS
ncbi:uncharacterized protein LOC131024792 [Salvia miltiorrhiza]|uniref:uncharacterized protein LOC131024792 n=1 Tax=Salvia miltiorrhiza TaxID=226208 RepID=UPI0025ABB8CF|nr:uncharacterized protein LOC131024792 [Salvia miltiorrhiza]